MTHLKPLHFKLIYVISYKDSNFLESTYFKILCRRIKVGAGSLATPMITIGMFRLILIAVIGKYDSFGFLRYQWCLERAPRYPAYPNMHHYFAIRTS